MIIARASTMWKLPEFDTKHIRYKLKNRNTTKMYSKYQHNVASSMSCRETGTAQKSISLVSRIQSLQSNCQSHFVRSESARRRFDAKSKGIRYRQTCTCEASKINQFFLNSGLVSEHDKNYMPESATFKKSKQRRNYTFGNRQISFLKPDSMVFNKERRQICHAQKQQFSSFEDMLRCSDEPVLVDFYATWCGPCVMMSKELEEVSKKFKGALRVVKVDCDRYPNLAAQHNIGGLPTIVLFKNGLPVMKEEGFIPAKDLAGMLSYYIGE